MRNLNKPPRYNIASIQAQQTLGGDVMQADENGQYVTWRDYAWLLSEVERLKAELADEKSANANVEGRLNSANRGLSMRNHLLQAEVDRLKAEKDQAECDHDNCQRRKVSIDNHRIYLFTENKNLKAEVERLRASSFVTAVPVEQYERVIKAGDALARIIAPPTHGTGEWDGEWEAWNAAKEGKPSK